MKFEEEKGQDEGGLTTEWQSLILHEIFNPAYGLFALCTNQRFIQQTATTFLVPNYLTHFRYIGRFLGKMLIGKAHRV